MIKLTNMFKKKLVVVIPVQFCGSDCREHYCVFVCKRDADPLDAMKEKFPYIERFYYPECKPEVHSVNIISFNEPKLLFEI